MKLKWLLFPVILLVMAGITMMGCSNPASGGGGGDPPGDATWTLEQKGGAEDSSGVGTDTTTHIIVKFNKGVSDLKTQNVTIAGAAKKDGPPVKGGGNDWEIPIKDVSSGTVSVTIKAQTGVVSDTKTVVVYKVGETTPITYTAIADGTAGTTSSTKIVFTFSEAVTDLVDTEITFTGAAADKGAGLTGSGTKWTLPIIANSEGSITVKIEHDGVEETEITVPIHYKAPNVAEDYVITRLTIITGDDDNPTAGKVEGTSFDAIIAAKYGSFLRITVDTSHHSNSSAGPGWGIGAIGNFVNDEGDFDGSINLGFAWPPTGTAYVDVPLAQAKRYLNPDDDFLYVNIWNSCTIVKVELYAKKVADTPPALGEGVIALIGVPSDEPANPGKGKIGYVDYMLIINSDDACVLKFYCTATGNIGYIGKDWGSVAPIRDISVAANGIFKMTVGGLKATGIETTKEIVINVWTGGITKIELCEAVVSDVTPIVIYDVTDGSISCMSDGEGAEVTFKGLKIALADDSIEYEGIIEFSPNLDITGYTKLTIEWNGIYTEEVSGASDFNMFKLQFQVLFSDGKKVSHDVTINSSPATFEFEAEAVNWDASWDEVDTEKCSGFRFYSNYQQKKSDGYAQLTDDELEDLYITRIVLE